MKRLYSTLTVLTVVSLIACGKNGPNKPGISTSAASSVNGTIDGGGGNSFKDKMLESYIVKPESISGYELLKPLLKNLNGILNYDDPNNIDDKTEGYEITLLKYVLNKTWYVIPSEITAITNEKIGVPFNDGTTQVAYQTFDAIWINELAFSKMSQVEKAKLLLHEIVMGLKILKFESDSNFGLALGYPFPEENKSEDDETVIHPHRMNLKLSSDDVSQVRLVTNTLWRYVNEESITNGTFSDGFSRYEFAALLKRNDFDRPIYHDKKINVTVTIYQLLSGYKVKNIDRIFSDINRVGDNLSTDHWPEDAKNEQKTMKAHSSCVVRIIKKDKDTASVKVDISPLKPADKDDKRSISFNIRIPTRPYYTYGQLVSHDRPSRQVQFLSAEAKDMQWVFAAVYDNDGLSGVTGDYRAIRDTVYEGKQLSEGSDTDGFECLVEPEWTVDAASDD